MPDPDADALTRLRRWEDAGGTWRVVGRRDGVFTVALYRCDGGEEVDRCVSADPRLLAHLGQRETSEDLRTRLAD